MACAFAVGCGFAGGLDLTLGYLEWDENIAVSRFTKVLLQEELGYENVELKLADDVKSIHQMGASVEADAFQDIRMLNREKILSGFEDDVELLDSWYEGKTKISIAIPSYMNVSNISELNAARVAPIIGIESGPPFMYKLTGSVIPKYNFEQKRIVADTPTMLAEVKKRYRTRENFAFVAWTPHWMNEAYDFDYLEDPKGALGDLSEGSDVSTIVREGLAEKDPTAYAFMDRLELTGEQVETLEIEINQAGDRLEGARTWLRANQAVIEPWVEAAKDTQEG